MMPVPWAAGPVRGWRLHLKERAATWDSGNGSKTNGGRWSPIGYPVVYCSADPATAILEVAVHQGFDELDTVPHVLTSARVLDANDVHVVTRDEVPNPGWLRSGWPSRGQQVFGRDLLERHLFVLIPSAVVEESWNLVFNPDRAAGRYELSAQRRFSLDTRLNLPH